MAWPLFIALEVASGIVISISLLQPQAAPACNIAKGWFARLLAWARERAWTLASALTMMVLVSVTFGLAFSTRLPPSHRPTQAAFQIVSGTCTTFGACVFSPNFPEPFDDTDCIIRPSSKTAVSADHLEAESCCSGIVINGDTMTKPFRDEIPQDDIIWRSTNNNPLGYRGFALCVDNGALAAPSGSRSPAPPPWPPFAPPSSGNVIPPSPPAPPGRPPTPPGKRVTASTCVLIDPTLLPAQAPGETDLSTVARYISSQLGLWEGWLLSIAIGPTCEMEFDPTFGAPWWWRWAPGMSVTSIRSTAHFRAPSSSTFVSAHFWTASKGGWDPYEVCDAILANTTFRRCDNLNNYVRSCSGVQPITLPQRNGQDVIAWVHLGRLCTMHHDDLERVGLAFGAVLLSLGPILILVACGRFCMRPTIVRTLQATVEAIEREQDQPLSDAPAHMRSSMLRIARLGRLLAVLSGLLLVPFCWPHALLSLRLALRLGDLGVRTPRRSERTMLTQQLRWALLASVVGLMLPAALGAIAIPAFLKWHSIESSPLEASRFDPNNTELAHWVRLMFNGYHALAALFFTQLALSSFLPPCLLWILLEFGWLHPTVTDRQMSPRQLGVALCGLAALAPEVVGLSWLYIAWPLLDKRKWRDVEAAQVGVRSHLLPLVTTLTSALISTTLLCFLLTCFLTLLVAEEVDTAIVTGSISSVLELIRPIWHNSIASAQLLDLSLTLCAIENPEFSVCRADLLIFVTDAHRVVHSPALWTILLLLLGIFAVRAFLGASLFARIHSWRTETVGEGGETLIELHRPHRDDKDKYVGQPADLIVGLPQEAAMGIFSYIQVDEHAVRQAMTRGMPAIVDEIQSEGTAADRENLDYLLHHEAGSSKATFQNGWQRDRSPQGDLLPERQTAEGRGMRLADFCAHMNAQSARLSEAHVLALRLYTTSSFTSINAPLRQLQRHPETGLILEPPKLMRPHPMPVTVAFLHEALKRMRSLAAENAANDQASDQTSGRTSLNVGSEAQAESISTAMVEHGAGDDQEVSSTTRSASSWELLLKAPLAAMCFAQAPARGGVLYRGMKNLQLTESFIHRGGTELAPMSTTSDLKIAVRYAQGSSTCLIFCLSCSSFMNLGCDLTWLSAFPHEQEFLYPPLTFMRPTGRRCHLTHGQTKFVILDVEPQYPS